MEAVGNYVGEMPKTIACCCGTSVQGGNTFVPELELLYAFRDIRVQGVTSVRKITDELNRRDILTARGAAWHPTTTARLLARLA